MSEFVRKQMNRIDKFIWWYNDTFKQTSYYLEMARNAEGSPWHREHSIASHTDMVVTQYLRIGSEKFHDYIHGAFACAFHDVGKPSSRIEKYSEARGNYSAFHGHEQASARMWENYAVKNWEYLKEEFGFSKEDIYKIGFLIEQHKPWELKDSTKLARLGYTLDQYEMRRQFTAMCMADSRGRIADDYDEKISKADKWLMNFNSDYREKYFVSELEKPVLYVPIAPSGAGKSTYWHDVLEEDYSVQNFSLDTLRLEYYEGSYEECFKQSTEDKNFMRNAHSYYMGLLKSGTSVYLDNTNTSKKNRRFYIDEARKKGYYIKAVLFPVTIETVLVRQETRPDKTVPQDAVLRQYTGLHLPQIGEVDEIGIVF